MRNLERVLAGRSFLHWGLILFKPEDYEYVMWTHTTGSGMPLKNRYFTQSQLGKGTSHHKTASKRGNNFQKTAQITLGLETFSVVNE